MTPLDEQNNNDTEIWKNIIGFPNYQVSSRGNVRSCYKGEWKLIIKSKTYGYEHVLLYKDKTRKNARVHRLVAEAFIPNPNNLPFVNHKDENRSNNNVDNLEWCTAKYNINYGTCIKRATEKQERPVLMLTINGMFERRFKSVTEAEKETGFSHSHITECCNNKKKQYKNHIWKYEQK